MQILLHADLLVNSYLYQICGILGSSAFPGSWNELLHTQDHLCSLVTSSFLMGIHGLSHPEAKTVQHRKYDCRVWMNSVRKQRHSRWENTAPHKECVKGRTEFGLKQNAAPHAHCNSTSLHAPRCSQHKPSTWLNVFAPMQLLFFLTWTYFLETWLWSPTCSVPVCAHCSNRADVLCTALAELPQEPRPGLKWRSAKLLFCDLTSIKVLCLYKGAGPPPSLTQQAALFIPLPCFHTQVNFTIIVFESACGNPPDKTSADNLL